MKKKMYNNRLRPRIKVLIILIKHIYKDGVYIKDIKVVDKKYIKPIRILKD